MKKCANCKENKSETEYGFRSGKRKAERNPYCKLCRSDITKSRMKFLKEENSKQMEIFLETSGGCVDCGVCSYVLLDFDHMKDKKHNISHMISRYSWSTILKEINKCEIRCSNCHTLKTSKEFGWYAYLDKNSHVLKASQRLTQRNMRLLFEYYSSHPCIDCGETNPVLLDSDHIIYPKKFEISYGVCHYGDWKRIEKELQKCVSRCKNCHRIKTSKERAWYK